MENCNAKYGGIDDTMKELQNYVNLQINRNWQFLLLVSLKNLLLCRLLQL